MQIKTKARQTREKALSAAIDFERLDVVRFLQASSANKRARLNR